MSLHRALTLLCVVSLLLAPTTAVAGQGGPPPAEGDIEDRINYYPKNDFVKFIVRQGLLKMFLNVLVPFMAD